MLLLPTGTSRQSYPAPVSPAGRGEVSVAGALDEARDLLLNYARGLVAPLAQLALDARPGALDLLLHAGAGGGAPTLELRQVTAYVATEPRELLLGLVAARVGLDRLDDVVPSDERRTHRNQRGTLSLVATVSTVNLPATAPACTVRTPLVAVRLA